MLTALCLSATSVESTHHLSHEFGGTLVVLCRFSIHANQKTGEAKAVMQKMPMAVEECPNVYHTGFSSADSFGSTAYLIVREDGNVLVDSPRFHPQLLTQIKVRKLIKFKKSLHATLSTGKPINLNGFPPCM